MDTTGTPHRTGSDDARARRRRFEDNRANWDDRAALHVASGYGIEELVADPSQGSILAVLTNVTAMAAFPHVVSGAWLVAGAFLTGVASWHMVRHHRAAREILSWLAAHRTEQGSLPEKVLHDGRPAQVAPLAWTAANTLLALDALAA